MPRKDTEKIGDAENRCQGCRDKNRWKRATIPLRLVLSRVRFKSGVWNYMPKYVLSLLVNPKLKNLLSVLRYRLPRFRGKGQNQRIATFWRHKSIEIDRLNNKLVSICGPFRSKNKTWYSDKNPVFKCMDFFMKCANVAFSVVPRIRAGDAENWNRVWVRYGLLFWHIFGTVCCFSTRIYLQHIARPVESDRLLNIAFVRPFFRSQFMNVGP